MIPGTFVNGSTAVRAVTGLPSGTVIRRGHGTPRPPGGPAPGPGACGRAVRLPAQVTGRAVTAHSPGLMPRTSALTATGPLPGRIGPAVISRVKVSPGFGLPVTPARRPGLWPPRPVVPRARHLCLLQCRPAAGHVAAATRPAPGTSDHACHLN